MGRPTRLMRSRFFATTAAILALTIGGCAGGRPRMLGTSAESARDPSRLRSMIGDCAGAARGDVESLSLTPEQTAQATLIYFWLTFQSAIAPQYGYSGETREAAMRQVMYQLNRYTKCLREKYHVPIETAQIVRSSRNDLPCGDRAVAEVLGNMGVIYCTL